MFIVQKRDFINSLLLEELKKPGLIDWVRIEEKLFLIGCTVERQVLHRRMKKIIKETFKH